METSFIIVISAVLLAVPVMGAAVVVRRIHSSLTLFEIGAIGGTVVFFADYIYRAEGSPKMNFVESELALFVALVPIWCVVRLGHRAYAKLVES